MNIKTVLLFFLGLVFCFFASIANAQGDLTQPKFLVTATFSDAEPKPGAVVAGSIFVTMPDGWHIYAAGVEKYNQLSVDTGDGPLKNVRLNYPPVKTIIQFGKEVPVYSGTVQINVAGIAPADHSGGDIIFRAVVTWQGCTDNMCLAPESRVVQVPIRISTEK